MAERKSKTMRVDRELAELAESVSRAQDISTRRATKVIARSFKKKTRRTEVDEIRF